MSPKQRSSIVSATEARSEAHAEHVEAKRLIPVWAIGETRAMSERERRLTAAIYAQLPGVLEHVTREGTLPEKMGRGGSGGREIGVRVLVNRRGTDIELTEEERVVFEAIGREGAPSGWVVLIDSRRAR